MSDKHPASVEQVLSEQFTGLSTKQQQVARVLIDDPAFVSFASAAELAARAGVDPATVVRTCQSLGYAGWRELQQEVRDTFAHRRTFAQRVESIEGDGDGDLTSRIFATAVDNVTGTLEQLDRRSLMTVARRIAGAGATVVVAGGVSQGAGMFLTSSLQILGHRALLGSGVADAGALLGSLQPGDVVLGVSVWRYLRGTLQALQIAKESGAVTVAVTDSAASPAALIADLHLTAQTRTVGPRLGMAGMATLIEAIVAAVAAADPGRALEATTRANRLYFDGNVEGSLRNPTRRSAPAWMQGDRPDTDVENG